MTPPSGVKQNTASLALAAGIQLARSKFPNLEIRGAPVPTSQVPEAVKRAGEKPKPGKSPWNDRPLLIDGRFQPSS